MLIKKLVFMAIKVDFVTKSSQCGQNIRLALTRPHVDSIIILSTQRDETDFRN